jgi:hypothetical protein
MDEEFELTPELEAELTAAMEEMDAGFFYTVLDGRQLRCSKCNRTGFIGEPFPHKYACPMKRL